MSIVFQLIDAIGSIATAIAVIITLAPYRTRLKISGEIPIRKSKNYVLNIVNPRNRDNEIKAIMFCKGNPRSSQCHIFYCVEFSHFQDNLNPHTNNVMIPSMKNIELSIPCGCIVCNYDIVGEPFGKPFDTIYIRIKDIRGNIYTVNTHCNIDLFRNVGC